MPNAYFQFKQFTVHQQGSAMKVSTDACVFGAYAARHLVGQMHSSSKILDIGSGTGLLSLMMAQQSAAEIHAIELDESACKQTDQNFLQSPWAERLFIHWDDIRTWKNESRFDLVISNPPFFEKHLWSQAGARNVARHDATLKLAELAAQMEQRLRPGGYGAVLLPYQRSGEMKDLLEKRKLYSFRVLYIKQTPVHDFFRSIFLFQQGVQNAILEEQLSIRENPVNYSLAFVDLLKDYYLYL